MAWLAHLDAQSRRLPFFMRGFYLFLKWTLVVLGAYMLLGLYFERWGIPATIWLLGAPFVYGIVNALSRATAAPSTPPQR